MTILNKTKSKRAMDFYQNNPKIRDLIKNPSSYQAEVHQNTLTLCHLIDHEKTSIPVLRYFAIDCAIAARKLYEARSFEPLNNKDFNQFVRIFIAFVEGGATWSDLSLAVSSYAILSVPKPCPLQLEGYMHSSVINAVNVDARIAAHQTADTYLSLMLATPMSECQARKQQILMLGRRIYEEMESRRTLLEVFEKKMRLDTAVESFLQELDKASFL